MNVLNEEWKDISSMSKYVNFIENSEYPTSPHNIQRSTSTNNIRSANKYLRRRFYSSDYDHDTKSSGQSISPVHRWSSYTRPSLQRRRAASEDIHFHIGLPGIETVHEGEEMDLVEDTGVDVAEDSGADTLHQNRENTHNAYSSDFELYSPGQSLDSGYSSPTISYAPPSETYAPRSDSYAPPIEHLLFNLSKLYQEGFITVTEYQNRRMQLVDEVPTIIDQATSSNFLMLAGLPVVYHDPPDFSTLKPRQAIKHVFDSEARMWTSVPITIKIDTQPFAKGGLRQVYHLQDMSLLPNESISSFQSMPNTETRYNPAETAPTFVAKIAINPNEDPDTYFRDVEMQAMASRFARLYNSYNPPRRVDFVDAWILQLLPDISATSSSANSILSNSIGGYASSLSSPGISDIPSSYDSRCGGDESYKGSGQFDSNRNIICGVEPFIPGEYLKHNNNFGYVSDLERNTPQAFSHFTYEASGHEILVVDIQGVGDRYTDPQIHTRNGKEFGKGNLATTGFQKFLATHRCNPICQYLKLPLHNPLFYPDEQDAETIISSNAVNLSVEASNTSKNGSNDPNNSISKRNQAKGTIPAEKFMRAEHIRVEQDVGSDLCHYYRGSAAFEASRGATKKYQRGRVKYHKQPTNPSKQYFKESEHIIKSEDITNEYTPNCMSCDTIKQYKQEKNLQHRVVGTSNASWCGTNLCIIS